MTDKDNNPNSHDESPPDTHHEASDRTGSEFKETEKQKDYYLASSGIELEVGKIPTNHTSQNDLKESKSKEKKAKELHQAMLIADQIQRFQSELNERLDRINELITKTNETIDKNRVEWEREVSFITDISDAIDDFQMSGNLNRQAIFDAYQKAGKHIDRDLCDDDLLLQIQLDRKASSDFVDDLDVQFDVLNKQLDDLQKAKTVTQNAIDELNAATNESEKQEVLKKYQTSSFHQSQDGGDLSEVDEIIKQSFDMALETESSKVDVGSHPKMEDLLSKFKISP